MEERSNGGGSGSQGSSGSDIPITSRVDPTSVMPVFDQGRAVDSMSVEEAQKEWKEMTVSDEKYKDFPRSVFLSRRDALWKLGFNEKIKQDKKGAEEEGSRRAEEAKERLADYVDELHQKKTEKVIREKWGNNTDQEIEFVQNFVLENASQEFKDYLDETRLGDNPNVIFFAHGLANLVKAYPDASFIIPALEKSVREYAEGVRRNKKEKTELTKRGGK
jgi:hypothetical protein